MDALRPSYPGLRLIAVGMVVLAALYAVFPEVRAIEVDSANRYLLQIGKQVDTHLADLRRSGNRTPAHSLEFARFNADGGLVIWSDGYVPADPNADSVHVDAGTSVVLRSDQLLLTSVADTDSGRVNLQTKGWPSMDGPFRMYATPVPGVSLYADNPDYLGPELHVHPWDVNGTRIGWFVSADHVRTASIWRAAWLTSLYLLMIAFPICLSRSMPSPWRPWVTALVLLVLPDWLIRSGWIAMMGAWFGVFDHDPLLTDLWIRGLSYVYPTSILVRSLLRAKRLYGLAWAPRTLAFSTFYGLVSGWGMLAITGAIHRLTSTGDYQVLGIDALPDATTILLYSGIGMVAASVMVVLFVAGWFLFNTESDHGRLVHAGAGVGFSIPYLLNMLATRSIGDELLWLAALSGLALYGLAYRMHQRPDAFRSLSPFRQLLTGVMLLCLYLFPLLVTANQTRYDVRMTDIAQRTAKTGIPPSERLGMEAPFRIVIYEDERRVDVTGDYITGQFVDRERPHPLYRTLASDESLTRVVDGPFFKYRETAWMEGGRTAVVSVRIQNRYNHLFALFRLFFILLGLILIAYPLIRYASGDRVDLFRGRERFEHRVLDTYIMSSFLFLLVLTFFTRQIILTQGGSRLELDLMSRLDMLAEVASDPEELIGIAERTEIEAYRYEGIHLADFSESVHIGGLSLSALLPYPVYLRLAQDGVDRATYRVETGQGPILVAYRTLGAGQVLAMPANLSANKHMDEILQTTSLSIIVYLVVFGLFIGGAVLITRELMQPIHQFRRGLTRISTGQLDTLIPVTSRDEIGELANAYNLMVYKLKDLQDELADKERQTAWAEMARQVAHEIKNPLTPMKLSVQHLHQQVFYGQKSAEEVKEMIVRISDTLIREIESLNNIANDFSKFARPITEDFVETDINETIRSILNLYQHDHRLYLWTDLDSGSLPVHAAPDELKRVVLNLVKNAMEAIPSGGLVVIRTVRHGGSAWIEVIDNGTGIPDDLKSRIFIPNFSTKSAGTGLGLAICRKVILAHKGDITFSSTPGLGTTFTIRLPLCDLT